MAFMVDLTKSDDTYKHLIPGLKIITTFDWLKPRV